jgi:hypothetical protein
MAELDHIFILCPVDAAVAAQALHRAGLTEGSPNHHEGQGTACRRFFFENAYIELLWVSAPQEARSEPTRRTRLWERWSGLPRAACPFGIVLRARSTPDAEGCPFPSWVYRPRYLPASLGIEIAEGTPLEEPEFLYLGFQRGRARQGAEPTTHRISASKITAVDIALPTLRSRSNAARALETMGLVSYTIADDYVVSLTLDNGTSANAADLRPDVPLVLRW